MVENFRLFEKHPDYVFNFTDSRRYRLMEVYKRQDLKLPSGDFNKVYILAAATEDTSGNFIVNGKPANLNIRIKKQIR